MEKGTRELHTLPDPASVVLCPLRAHQPIAMGRCVEYQRDNGCHCEHALVALRRTEKHLSAPAGHQSAYDATAQSDALDGVRTLIERAEQIEKARPAIVPNPARNPVPTPRNESASIAPKSARTPFLSEPKKPAPPPAEESSMGVKSPVDSVTDAEFRKAFEDASGSIEKVRKKFGCSHPAASRRAKALGLEVGPPRGRHAVESAAPAPKKIAPAPRLPRKPNNVRVLAPAKPAVHVATAPPIFKDLPKIESLPPEYLIACARYLYELRKRIEFALAGEAFHVEHQKPA